MPIDIDVQERLDEIALATIAVVRRVLIAAVTISLGGARDGPLAHHASKVWDDELVAALTGLSGTELLQRARSGPAYSHFPMYRPGFFDLSEWAAQPSLAAMLRMALAIGDYDHVRDLAEGRVRPEGLELTCQRLPPEEIFARFSARREWEAAEFSLALYVNRVSQGDRRMIGIPAFPSRVFRHGSFYARPDGPEVLEELAGARVGIPEWAQTAGVWARGIMAERHGVDIASVGWVQGGVNDANRREKASVELPAGIEVRRETERSLDALLRAGELDAVITARPPAGFASGEVRRLLADPQAAERAYWEETGVFPIMHLVVLRGDFLDSAPWAAVSLHAALDEARSRCAARLLDDTASHAPLPWVTAVAVEARERFGGELWPYGIEANRATLETFLRYAHDQGVASRRLSLDDLFPYGPDPVAV